MSYEFFMITGEGHLKRMAETTYSLTAFGEDGLEYSLTEYYETETEAMKHLEVVSNKTKWIPVIVLLRVFP